MIKVEALLAFLVTAGKGVTTAERQAQARVKTNEYFDFDRKELRDSGMLATVQGVAAQIETLRAAATDVGQIEAYDASLSVFTKWTDAKDAA